MPRRWLALLVMTLAAAVPAIAMDWPQFLGPDRNGTYTGPPLLETWGPSGPKVVWRKQVGQAFAGPVVVQNRVLLFHRVGNEEVLESLDAKTGAATWRYAYPTNYRDDFGFDEGPRAVPVVADGIVYTFGAARTAPRRRPRQGHARVERGHDEAVQRAEGILRRGRLSAGRRRTRHRQHRRTTKAGIVAFDAKTGKVLWTATDDDASYSSGMAATIRRPALARYSSPATNSIGLDPATGAIQFQRRWRARIAASVNAATPLVVGDSIFVSAEYGPGAGVLRVDGSTLTECGRQTRRCRITTRRASTTTAICTGIHGRQEFGPSLRAVELQDRRGQAGVRNSSAPAASRWPATGCSSCAKAAR